MIDIIGTLYDVGSEDQGNVIVTELDGYHVNSTSLVERWQQFKVEPSTPRQTFFGVPTYFYKFSDESEFDLTMNPPEQAEESQEEVNLENEEIHDNQSVSDDNHENQEIFDLPPDALAIDDSGINSLEFEIFGDSALSASSELDLDE